MSKNNFRELHLNEVIELLDVQCKTSASLKIFHRESREEYTASFVSYRIEDKVITVLSHALINSSLPFDGIMLFEQGSLQYLAQCEISQEQRNIKIVLHSPLYITDKRKNFRLEASTRLPMKLSISGTSYTLVDLSTGGISVLVSAKETQFTQQSLIHKIVIEILKDKIEIEEAIIRYIKKTENPEELKLGISFLHLSHEEEARIFKIINSALYESLYVNKR